jgi:glutathione S-transferase
MGLEKRMMQIVGRRSSLFTRIALMFAEELAVSYQYEPIYDMTVVDPSVYANNPALKLPILRIDESVIFGTLNICRVLAEKSGSTMRIVWPEAQRNDVSRNAQELVWHCAATQVQLVMGTVINKLPADNPFFAKARSGMENSLRWLDQNLSSALNALPARDLSVFEVSLYCLIEHLVFRPTMSVDSYKSLTEFSRLYSQRPAASVTTYRLDVAVA